ncbi:MAG: DNA polymerase III subunit alpha [Desulfatibacillaceae bacterium]
MADFVHLHVHTQYSLLDGAIRLDPLMTRAAEFGMDSVAITDHGTMFGTVHFYEKAKKAGIKPIIGCEMYLAPRGMEDRTPADKDMRHLVLLAKNREGYVNLCKMATDAQFKGFYYKPRIDKALLKTHSEGLIALSACLGGEIPKLIMDGKIEEADEAARWYRDLFGENGFFLEVQENGMDDQVKVNEALRDMSRRLSIGLVATNDCHYLLPDDARAHEVLLCIQTQKTVHDKDRFHFDSDQLYFKSPGEMAAAFAEYPGAIENTRLIADQCNVEMDFNTYHFPHFPVEEGEDEESLLRKKAWEGFEGRMKVIRRNNPDVDEEKYKKQQEYELDVICNMGFPGYFLIVADFIQYGKQNGIPVGPGRGSAAGSIVAYSLGITDLDPIENKLIFERFLNPARKSMPDIDVDFCINGRERVFEYVSKKYGGPERVCQIITYGSMKTRAVLRDVGRALGMPFDEVDQIAKMVPDVLGISLAEAREQEPRINEEAGRNPNVAQMLEVGGVLEGLPRHASVHAAGVVIGDKPLVEYLPLFKGRNDEAVTQYDMKCVEKIGLVKFDFLGLRNLTVIDKALSLIREQGKEAPDILDLDMQDPRTFALLQAGDTTGVFQLESSGMKELMIRLRPECFEDIVALVALYRPGPLDSGMAEQYVMRKHGQAEVDYILPQLEPVLKDTYGVIIYQEQVMQIAATLADYSMAEADDLRKAMGKKIQELMARHRVRFLEGAEKNNIDLKKAEHIFDLMETFGRYGFNKAHSACYGLIAYQTAYLKAHYPTEFLASLLTSEMSNSDKIVKLINECRTHDIPVLPPDINVGQKEFTVKDGKIVFGLRAVKNVGEGAIEAMVESRREGPFTSIYDFCERVDLRRVNKRVVESLIHCGAFDSVSPNRASLAAGLEGAFDYGQRMQKEKNDPQMGLFESVTESMPEHHPELPDVPEWDDMVRLNHEKDTIGFFITGHPLDAHRDIMDKYTNANTSNVREMGGRSDLRVGGMVQTVKQHQARGGPMAFVTIEDYHGTIEIVVFPSLFANVSSMLVPDSPVLVRGRVEADEKNAKILAEQVIPMDHAEHVWTTSVHIRVDMSRMNRDILERLRDLLREHKGGTRGFLHMVLPDKAETVIALPDDFSVRASRVLSHEVCALFGYNALSTQCQPAPDKGGNGDGRGRHYRSARN